MIFNQFAKPLIIGVALWVILQGKRHTATLAEELPEHAVATLGSNWLRHAEGVGALAFSQKGNYLVSGGSDRYLRIWDLDHRRLAHQFSGETAYGHCSVAVSPDATKVVAGTVDGLVRVWDVATGLLSWEQQLHGDSGTSQVAFFSDGQRIASSGMGGMVVVSDVETGKTITSINCHSMDTRSRELAFAISPDDSSVALGSWDDIEIVPVKAPNARKTIVGAHGAGIASLCYTQDGTRLLSCGASRKQISFKGQRVISYSAERKLWSLHGNKLVREFKAEMPDAGIGSGRISSDRRVIATANGAIEIWDLETGERLNSIENWSRFDGWYRNGFVLSPDGKTIATVEHSAILLRDSQTGERVLDENEAHNGAVTDVAFSRNRLWIASAGRGGDVRIWDRNARTLSHTLIPLGSSTIQTDRVAFSPNSGRVLAAGTCRRGQKIVGTLSLLDTVSGEPIKTRLLDRRATFAQFSNSGKQVIVGAGIVDRFGGGRRAERTPRIYLYDEKLKQSRTASMSIGGRVLAAFGAEEGGDFYFVEDSKNLWHWNSESNVLMPIQLEASRSKLKSAAFTRDGKVVATSGLFDEMIYLWETATGKQIAKFNYGNSKGAMLAFSPDSTLLAIAPIGITHTKTQYAKNVVLWDTKNELTVRELHISMPNVSAIEFSPDGSELITGHEDGTLTLWTVP